jgi:hypothetical protein
MTERQRVFDRCFEAVPRPDRFGRPLAFGDGIESVISDQETARKPGITSIFGQFHERAGWAVPLLQEYQDMTLTGKRFRISQYISASILSGRSLNW